MSQVLTQQLDTRIDTIVKSAYASIQAIEVEQQQALDNRELRVRAHRRERKIYRRHEFRWRQKRLELGMRGLRVLLEIGQSHPIQRLIKLNADLEIYLDNGTGGARFCFYYADSAREDAPDSIALYFSESGLSFWCGCNAVLDFGEVAFFKYDDSEEELRALLSQFVGRHTDDAFEMLDPNAKRAYEWGYRETHIGFQVTVDCGNPERLPLYIDTALKNYQSVLGRP